MMKYFIIMMCLSLTLFANTQSTDGRFSLGYWSVNQDTLDQDNATLDDNVGENYLQDAYRVVLFDARLYRKVKIEDSKKERNLYFHLKSRFNLDQGAYTLAFNERSRHQLSELAFEFKNAVQGRHDLWLGRQLILENGGVRFDGLRAVFNLKNKSKFGMFAGLGPDPRNSLGYIGNDYEEKIFSTDFIHLGTYYSIRQQTSTLNIALNTELFNNEIDRLYSFIQGTYQFRKNLFLYGLLNIAFVPRSLDHLMLNARYNLSEKIKLTSTFSRWSNIEYAASGTSQIPLDNQASPANYINGNIFNDTHYTQFKNQIHYSFLKNQSALAGIDYTKRSFDDLQRTNYFLAYSNHNLFDQFIDFRLQYNIIENYKSAHQSIDATLGRDFFQNAFRLEGSYNRIKTERAVYINNQVSSLPTENEREHSFGVSSFYYFGKGSLMHAQYQIFKEEDSLNQGDKITLQELYLGTQFSF